MAGLLIRWEDAILVRIYLINTSQVKHFSSSLTTGQIRPTTLDFVQKPTRKSIFPKDRC